MLVIETQKAKIEEQSKRITELEETIHQLTGGASILPEKTKPKFKPSRRTRKRRRKNGQKKGHKGLTRPKPTHIDKFEECKLENCPDCGGELSRPIGMTPADFGIISRKTSFRRRLKPPVIDIIAIAVPIAKPAMTLLRRVTRYPTPE